MSSRYDSARDVGAFRDLRARVSRERNPRSRSKETQ